MSHFGGDRAAYIRDLIERDIFGTSHGQKQQSAELGTKRTFDSQQWSADMKLLAIGAEQIPVLPPEAFTRKSIYSYISISNSSNFNCPGYLPNIVEF